MEVHGANGYLIQQFLAGNANTREDAYGGSVANRARFALEVADAVAAEIGAERTGFRVSPGARLGGLDEGSDTHALYLHLVEGLARLNLAYLHISHQGDDALLGAIRASWPNVLLVNRGNRPLERITTDVDAGLADMAPIGRWALANPDFVERYRLGASLNDADPSTFYGGDARGYTDYPRLAQTTAATTLHMPHGARTRRRTATKA